MSLSICEHLMEKLTTDSNLTHQLCLSRWSLMTLITLICSSCTPDPNSTQGALMPSADTGMSGEELDLKGMVRPEDQEPREMSVFDMTSRSDQAVSDATAADEEQDMMAPRDQAIQDIGSIDMASHSDQAVSDAMPAPVDCHGRPAEASELEEVCDGDDNDCDGDVDEGVLNDCGTCGALTEEACDEVDNDCDGDVDEDTGDECGVCPLGQRPSLGTCLPAYTTHLITDYAQFSHTPGSLFTPAPASVPFPEDRCAQQMTQRTITPGALTTAELCDVGQDVCLIVESGATLSCPGALNVSGVLWVRSGDDQTQTLLIADALTVEETGELHITGVSEDDPDAHKVELFLRHEFCGRPEICLDELESRQAELDCLDKGRLISRGITKMRGLPKTPWSQLTVDSALSHADTVATIQIDNCSGWASGDLLTIAATGRGARDWAGATNHRPDQDPNCGPDCSASVNFQSERRQIVSIQSALDTDGECLITLDQPLFWNHQGSPVEVGSVRPRIQAEVLNHSRSILITGGHHDPLSDPETRIPTRYDYAEGGAYVTDYADDLQNERAPCKVCRMPSGDAHTTPASGAELCTLPESCTAYDFEEMLPPWRHESEQACDPIPGFRVWSGTYCTERTSGFAPPRQLNLCGERCSPYGYQGITTRQEHHHGAMQLSHVEIERCGRRDLAEYCLHLHHAGDVKRQVHDAEHMGAHQGYESYFIGNSIQRGTNKGITVHGTHNALIQGNVIFNQRGPGVYIEDGNELFNVVEENVVLCSEVQANAVTLGSITMNYLCRFHNRANRPQTSDSDFDEVAGLYFLSPMNHTIGNHVIGYDNGMYVNVNTQGARGLGSAWGKTCIPSLPWGYTIGNVFHNLGGFGWYANKAFPQRMWSLGAIELQTGTEHIMGTVTDWSACLPYNAAGEDHSFNLKIQNHFEYFNNFSAGVYDMGDVTLENYTVFGSDKGLYWKTYSRAKGSDPLCVNCTFINSGFNGPGGSGLVSFEDSQFYLQGHQELELNHHCTLDGGTGGLCASHYDFRTSQFYTELGAPRSPKFNSGADDRVAPVVLLPSDQTLVWATDNVAFDLVGSGCVDAPTTLAAEDQWWLCPSAPLSPRLIRIYSPSRGVLTVTNHTEGGAEYTIPFSGWSPQRGRGAYVMGSLVGCPPEGPCTNYQYPAGYTIIVADGHEISLSFSEPRGPGDLLHDLFALEYSEEQLSPITSITIQSVSGAGVMDGDDACVVTSTHDRAYLTPYGPINGAAGAWYRTCGQGWALDFTARDLIDQSVAALSADQGVEPVVACRSDRPPIPPEDVSAHVELCIDMNGAPYPDALFTEVYIRGTWNGWGAERLVLSDPDEDGIYCATEVFSAGDYEYQHAALSIGNEHVSVGPPQGSSCDWLPNDTFNNFGFRITDDQPLTICHRWDLCGCDD